jgi:hypothetical protein
MHRDCELGEAVRVLSDELERHSCTVFDHVSCHAVDLEKQEARLENTAIQQAETA